MVSYLIGGLILGAVLCIVGVTVRDRVRRSRAAAAAESKKAPTSF